MKIVIVGNGKMGKILSIVAKEQVVKIIENFEYDILEDNLDFDVLIDFSNRNNLKYIYEYCLKNKKRAVIATTNLKEEDYLLINKLAEEVAILVDSNFSYGITLLKKILNDNLKYFNNYDISLIETHHKYKKDAPSGTAKSIEELFKINNLKYDTISLRKGTVNGEHQVIFYGEDEYIEIKHTASSRKIYAHGALEAARWLLCKERGLFSYLDCLLKK